MVNSLWYNCIMGHHEALLKWGMSIRISVEEDNSFCEHEGHMCICTYSLCLHMNSIAGITRKLCLWENNWTLMQGWKEDLFFTVNSCAVCIYFDTCLHCPWERERERHFSPNFPTWSHTVLVLHQTIRCLPNTPSIFMLSVCVSVWVSNAPSSSPLTLSTWGGAAPPKLGCAAFLVSGVGTDCSYLCTRRAPGCWSTGMCASCRPRSISPEREVRTSCWPLVPQSTWNSVFLSACH